MLKKIKILVALASLIFSTTSFAQDLGIKYNIALPQLNVGTYILMDYHSGEILASSNPDQRQYPASLTKIMTSYVLGNALKEGKIKGTDTVIITESSWGKNFPGSSKMFLNLNQQVSIDDLNRGIIVVSGNDACVAVAEYVSGTEQRFIEQMNHFVKQFGLKNTNFTTVHGLDDENQYSSARDMAIMSAHLIRDLPNEYAIYAEKEFTFNKIKQPNRNGLLWDKTLKVDGLKTGHTSQAGYNLVASAVSGDSRLISVVMGVSTYKGREIESKKLLQWGFNNFETVKPLQAGANVSDQPVYYGKINNIQLGTLADGYITIPKGKTTELKARYELDDKYLEAPLTKGQVVGRVIYQLDGKDIASVNLQAMQDVEETHFLGRLADWVVLKFKGLFS